MKPWKEASTLILVARKHLTDVSKTSSIGNAYDYNLLTMKRSSKSSFYPNAIVFPGGITDSSDFSSNWMKVFRDQNIGSLIKSMASSNLPPLYKKNSFFVDTSNLIPEVGFRINAIRETFEETGVLIARDINSHSSNSEKANFIKLNNHFSTERSNIWRKRVAEDANQFFNLCFELEVYPDIFSLKEWSNWLTPTVQPNPKNKVNQKRYDTIFYTAFVDEEPTISIDHREAQSVKWNSPDLILEKFYNKDLFLSPPQIYEMSRLVQFTKYKDLCMYTKQRHSKGLECWFPVIYKLNDGVISTLFGDSLYPEAPNKLEGGIITLNETCEENLNKSECLHRMEVSGRNSINWRCNIKLQYDQITPVEHVET